MKLFHGYYSVLFIVNVSRLLFGFLTITMIYIRQLYSVFNTIKWYLNYVKQLPLPPAVRSVGVSETTLISCDTDDWSFSGVARLRLLPVSGRVVVTTSPTPTLERPRRLAVLGAAGSVLGVTGSLLDATWPLLDVTWPLHVLGATGSTTTSGAGPLWLWATTTLERPRRLTMGAWSVLGAAGSVLGAAGSVLGAAGSVLGATGLLPGTTPLGRPRLLFLALVSALVPVLTTMYGTLGLAKAAFLWAKAAKNIIKQIKPTLINKTLINKTLINKTLINKTLINKTLIKPNNNRGTVSWLLFGLIIVSRLLFGFIVKSYFKIIWNKKIPTTSQEGLGSARFGWGTISLKVFVIISQLLVVRRVQIHFPWRACRFPYVHKIVWMPFFLMSSSAC